jgi:hypothetical protein
MTAHFSDRERATFLAALRYWQQDLAADEEGPISPDQFNDEITPLTIQEIDDLCERLNNRNSLLTACESAAYALQLACLDLRDGDGRAPAVLSNALQTVRDALTVAKGTTP